MDSDRNRPPELQDDPAQKSQDPENQAAMLDLRHRIEEGMAPPEVADRVFEAIRKEAFCLCLDYFPSRWSYRIGSKSDCGPEASPPLEPSLGL